MKLPRLRIINLSKGHPHHEEPPSYPYLHIRNKEFPWRLETVEMVLVLFPRYLEQWVVLEGSGQSVQVLVHDDVCACVGAYASFSCAYQMLMQVREPKPGAGAGAGDAIGGGGGGGIGVGGAVGGGIGGGLCVREWVPLLLGLVLVEAVGQVQGMLVVEV
ncbi:unnamed protein product [Fraxinus pennsylvanica]|uniref:Uncharacterized protein n=1 Tax=Fraxinus pennsylvanica TaxID=56036 RepID=A0AAD2A890_9LAMI|nr:unnamed protein product [Fraxinus pennsylvanica]